MSDNSKVDIGKIDFGFGNAGQLQQHHKKIMMEQRKAPKQINYLTAKDNLGEFEQRLRDQALTQGPSASTQHQLGQVGGLAQSQYSQAAGNLAQRGGLGSGARERLAQSAMRQGMANRQNVLAAGENQKLGLQKGFVNQEAADRSGQNTFNLDQYKSRLSAYAASENARQQENLSRTSGGLFGSGGFLGTGF